jgi:hypothetical protein
MAAAEAIRKQAGLADASSEAVHAMAQKLATEVETSQLDLMAKSARHDALADAIAKLTAQGEAKAKDDPLAAELEQIVKMRLKEVERMRRLVDQKAASDSELDHAIGAVAEARAKLIERQLTAAAANGGDTAAVWNRELLSLSIDLAEIRARANALEKRLSQVSEALSALDHRPSPASMQGRLDDASRQLIELDKRISEITGQLGSGNETSVNVIESTDEPARDAVPSTAP